MGGEVAEAITPSPSPAGTAVRRDRNNPARAATQAYSATMICTATKGRNVGLRSEFVIEVRAPAPIPTPGPANAVARIVPVVSRNNGRPTAATAAESARLMATATGIR